MKKVLLVLAFITITFYGSTQKVITDKTIESKSSFTADLAITEVKLIEATRNEQTLLHKIKVLVTIKNNGQAASGSTYLQMMIQNRRLNMVPPQSTQPNNPWYELGETQMVNSIPADKSYTGEYQFIEIKKVTESNEFSIRLVADAGNKVKEVNEKDNFSASIEVSPVAAPPEYVAAGRTIPADNKIDIPNRTRFSTNFTIPGFESRLDNVTFSTPVRYNLDPTTIQIGDKGITCIKGGLYHFELYIEAQIGYPTAISSPPKFPSIHAELNVGQRNNNYTLIDQRIGKNSNNPHDYETNFYFGELVSFEVYVAAGSIVRVRAGISDPSGGKASGSFIGGHLSGYLIME